MSTPRSAPAPSVRVAQQKQRPPWLPWLIGLLALALVALVLFFVMNGDDDTDPVATDTVAEQPVDPVETDEPVEPVETEPVEPAETEAVEPADAGGVLVLAVPFPSDLATNEGRTVSIERVPVVNVPGDEVFTIGSAEQELFVLITEPARAAGGPESEQNVEPGSTVTQLTGTLTPVDDAFLSSAGLTGAEAEAARALGVYVAASSFTVS